MPPRPPAAAPIPFDAAFARSLGPLHQFAAESSARTGAQSPPDAAAAVPAATSSPGRAFAALVPVDLLDASGAAGRRREGLRRVFSSVFEQVRAEDAAANGGGDGGCRLPTVYYYEAVREKGTLFRERERVLVVGQRTLALCDPATKTVVRRLDVADVEGVGVQGSWVSVGGPDGPHHIRVKPADVPLLVTVCDALRRQAAACSSPPASPSASPRAASPQQPATLLSRLRQRVGDPSSGLVLPPPTTAAGGAVSSSPPPPSPSGRRRVTFSEAVETAVFERGEGASEDGDADEGGAGGGEEGNVALANMGKRAERMAAEFEGGQVKGGFADEAALERLMCGGDGDDDDDSFSALGSSLSSSSSATTASDDAVHSSSPSCTSSEEPESEASEGFASAPSMAWLVRAHTLTASGGAGSSGAAAAAAAAATPGTWELCSRLERHAETTERGREAAALCLSLEFESDEEMSEEEVMVEGKDEVVAEVEVVAEGEEKEEEDEAASAVGPWSPQEKMEAKESLFSDAVTSVEKSGVAVGLEVLGRLLRDARGVVAAIPLSQGGVDDDDSAAAEEEPTPAATPTGAKELPPPLPLSPPCPEEAETPPLLPRAASFAASGSSSFSAFSIHVEDETVSSADEADVSSCDEVACAAASSPPLSPSPSPPPASPPPRRPSRHRAAAEAAAAAAAAHRPRYRSEAAASPHRQGGVAPPRTPTPTPLQNRRRRRRRRHCSPSPSPSPSQPRSSRGSQQRHRHDDDGDDDGDAESVTAQHLMLPLPKAADARGGKPRGAGAASLQRELRMLEELAAAGLLSQVELAAARAAASRHTCR